MMPPSRASTRSSSPRPPLRSAPTMCIRTSLDALPPSIGRSWHRITLAPLRAAASAAGTPAGPPPAIRTSQWSSQLLIHLNMPRMERPGLLQKRFVFELAEPFAQQIDALLVDDAGSDVRHAPQRGELHAVQDHRALRI